MGLDTTHNCWHGGYGRFMVWRAALAEAAGFPPLRLMEGFLDPREFFIYVNNVRIDLLDLAHRPMAEHNQAGWLSHGASQMKHLPIQWAYFEKDPLTVLLNHSDCSGELAAEVCTLLANRLEELLPALDEMDAKHPDPHVARLSLGGQTRQFIDGLRLAASLGEAVRFH